MTQFQGGEVLTLTKDQKAELGRSLSIKCKSLDDDASVQNLEDGNGTVIQYLINFSDAPTDYPDNLVCVSLTVFSNRERTDSSYCIRSRELYELIDGIATPRYDVGDLSNATSLCLNGYGDAVDVHLHKPADSGEYTRVYARFGDDTFSVELEPLNKALVSAGLNAIK